MRVADLQRPGKGVNLIMAARRPLNFRQIVPNEVFGGSFRRFVRLPFPMRLFRLIRSIATHGRGVVGLFIFLAAGAGLTAAPAAEARAEGGLSWAFSAFSIDAGLPNNVVSVVSQTRDGYLWI